MSGALLAAPTGGGMQRGLGSPRVNHPGMTMLIRDGPRCAYSRREASSFRRLAGFDPLSINCPDWARLLGARRVP